MLVRNTLGIKPRSKTGRLENTVTQILNILIFFSVDNTAFENEMSLANDRMKRSNSTEETSLAQHVKRVVLSRQKRRARRVITIHIKSCRVCRDLCFR